ncbi:MAG: cytochrome P450 [Proteobacteria bacterium]|nr:cytochrome P450 [Pseudomonadota bacterium]
MRAPNIAPQAARQFDLGATDQSLAFMRECFPLYGDTYRVFSPARGAFDFVINGPEDVKRVMLSNHRNYTKGAGLERVRLLLGNGIMCSEGEFWRRQRRMMQPAFHRRVITRFNELIGSLNEKYAERWAGFAARGEPINMTEETSELTLEIVLGSIFGSDLARIAQRHGGNPFEVVHKEPSRDLKFAFRFRSLGKLVSEVMQWRCAEGGEHFDFLAMLMDARDRDTGQAMEERELIDEVLTLVVAGHETTAAALTWTWYLLSQHRDAQARLQQEADRTPDTPAPTLDQAEALPYAQQVAQESLRLYPPGWLLARRTIEADQLGGYEVPPRSEVFICPYLLHRHPEHWEDPERFDPERFAAADAVERHRFAYVPFAVGPRHCIGEGLAMFEILVHLQRMARRFTITRADDTPIELEAQVNLRPRSNLMMRVTTR